MDSVGGKAHNHLPYPNDEWAMQFSTTFDNKGKRFTAKSQSSRSLEGGRKPSRLGGFA
jgi:hypothetical protein